MHDPIYEKDWNAVVTTGVRIRDIPCMESSVVLTSAPVGEILHVIAETDGYYKIERKDGTVGWIGQWLVTKTNQAFVKDNAPKEPLFDVVNHAYESAIRYLANKLIVQGYPDMSYKPDSTVNRVEFTKIVVGAAFDYNSSQDPSGYDIYTLSGVPYSDIKYGEWYVPYLRVATQNGLIGGYPDGTFKPANEVNFAEAAKILVEAFELGKTGCSSCSPWYEPYVKTLQNNSYIPSSIDDLNKKVTRGEMAEMIWRIMEEERSQPFSQFTF